MACLDRAPFWVAVELERHTIFGHLFLFGRVPIIGERRIYANILR